MFGLSRRPQTFRRLTEKFGAATHGAREAGGSMSRCNSGLFARLKSGGSRAALYAVATMALTGGALAQGGDNGQVESVTVSGFKASLERSLEEKRNATNAVDSILAEDIAKFPDTNLSESIQRIPGVALTRASSGGEGKQIAVRGLSP